MNLTKKQTSKPNYDKEISRHIPSSIRIPISEHNVPLLTAYECVLMEHDTGKNYTYIAINIKTGRQEVIARRSSPLTTRTVDAMVEKIRLSQVAGAGVMQADRKFGDDAPLEKCRDIMRAIFKEVLPTCGFTERKEQISLAFHILETINRRAVSLAEAEVGTGKSLGYLIPAIISKRARLNSYWNLTFYTGTPYVDMMDMPIVVATSSIALQKALITEVIPMLSTILLEAGVINTPIITALRKGREHYLCKYKLLSHLPFNKEHDIQGHLHGLVTSPTIDLSELDWLTPFTKRRISVPERCDKHCPERANCPYLKFRKGLESTDIDIQVCNHNYLLADTIRRSEGAKPLIPNYQMVIIDEAHKFLSAVRSMYGVELYLDYLLSICRVVQSIKFVDVATQGEIHDLADHMSKQVIRLFRKLEVQVLSAVTDDSEDEATRFSINFDADRLRNLRNIRQATETLIQLISASRVTGNGSGRQNQVLFELPNIAKLTATLIRHKEQILWFETTNKELKICAVPKNLEQKLYNHLWSKGVPIVLTSGTLSAGGDFTHTKRTLGIDKLSAYKILETSTPSPFNFKDNALIYISQHVPFPDQRDNAYILALVNEIEQLVYASHGNAAVLFTSYKTMDKVCDCLADRDIPFPVFQLTKGDSSAIEQFKASKNAILLATGTLWEGIDIPGDTLSLVIITKLPFPVPDPIIEYEKTLYDSFNEYKQQVIVHETAIKTKQGQGRGHRTETDTAVIGYLDSRLTHSPYLDYFGTEVFLDCLVTTNIRDVADFYIMHKDESYFYNPVE